MRIEHIGEATLILADCMEIMRDMPNKAFELAIVDPPYGDGGGIGRTSLGRGSAGGSTSTASESQSRIRRAVRALCHPRFGRAGHGQRSIKPKGVALATFDTGTSRHPLNTSKNFFACRNIRLFGAEITTRFHHPETSLCGEN